ncbi:hypothetical protein LMG22037_05747 [Paraburkholderia phenoliruptrix]|uniref:Secreted protein n=1 Tax=Paraburkholderia phenoliruptrix TaxID=252970 RepID=A0A6J5CBH1_9BURK|nr:hypothetical protein LMG22037_05747 [Paraburkholderia phenoliruptrix]
MQKLVLALTVAAVSALAHAEAGPHVAGSPCESNGVTAQSGANHQLICANGQWREQRAAAPYAATSSDDTLYTLVARWAATNGLQARWETGAKPPVIHDAVRLNETAHLESASTLSDAFTRVSKAYHAEHPDAPALVACVYRHDHIVAVSANGCGSHADN